MNYKDLTDEQLEQMKKEGGWFVKCDGSGEMYRVDSLEERERIKRELEQYHKDYSYANR